MSSVNILAPRQKDELHKAIIAYLNSNGLSGACAALREEIGAGDDFLDDTKMKKYEGLLEKKWTSVVRLQKKIMELESRTTALQSELDSSTPTSLTRRNQDPTAWLPRAPPRHNLTGHRLPVTAVAFHPVFSVLASASEDSTLKIWDWELGELERTIKGHTKSVLDCDFGGPKTATLLASCSSDLTIKLWDPANEYKNIRTLTGHDHSVSSVRFIPSAAGEFLVSASRDKSLRIWEVATGYCVKTISGHADWVRDVAPSVDGRWLLSAASDQTARVWDAATGEPRTTLLGHEHVVECGAFAPASAYPALAALAGLKKPPPASDTDAYLATGSRDKTVRIWDGRGTAVRVLAGHDNWVRAVAWHPGGKYLLSASDDKTVRCWDLLQEGRCVKTIDAHAHFISCLRWAPNVNKEPEDGAQTNGVAKTNGAAKAAEIRGIRCVLATGSVDMSVRVFA